MKLCCQKSIFLWLLFLVSQDALNVTKNVFHWVALCNLFLLMSLKSATWAFNGVRVLGLTDTYMLEPTQPPGRELQAQHPCCPNPLFQ